MVMKPKIELSIVTTKKDSLSFAENMNFKLPAIITNQYDKYETEKLDDIIMVTTPTVGVGINRNLGLSLSNAEYIFIADDDMVFYDDMEDTLEMAIKELPEADVIIFNFDYFKDGNKVRSRMKSAGRINLFSCLNYGICCTLVKTKTLKKNNINFSTLFGGGCKYGSGEDSLFFLECVRKNMKVFTYIKPVGMNEYRESTWFKGYNEKFFYDKGAWIACAFPKIKHLIKWYFIFRFKKLTKISFKDFRKYINDGIKGFKELKSFNEEE